MNYHEQIEQLRALFARTVVTSGTIRLENGADYGYVRDLVHRAGLEIWAQAGWMICIRTRRTA